MLVINYILWAAAALSLYRLLPRASAIWILLIVGWLLLPPARYAAPGNPSVFPYWIIGGALPSDVMISKAWVAPVTAVLASLLFERARWHGFRPIRLDAPILLFCLWPVLRLPFTGDTGPSGATSALYLLGVWGLPWLLGRVHLRSVDDMRAFAGVLAVATAATLPFAIVESLSAFRFQTLVVGVPPFAFDGMERYVGYRPQLFFEHGNQYGIWCAGAALAGAWRWQLAYAERRACREWFCVASMLALQTLASQSMGAVALLLAGGMLLASRRAFRILLLIVPFALALAATIGVLHVSGVVPLRSLAKETAIGRASVGILRETGRQSLAWRVNQDLKTIALIESSPVVGARAWDWFKPAGTRPWGLPLLILGQFGIIGLATLAVAFVTALQRLLSAAQIDNGAARLCVALILLSAVDALLNSFLFYPALVVAGAHLSRKSEGRRAPGAVGTR